MVIEEPIKTDKEKLRVALTQESTFQPPKPKQNVDDGINLKEIIVDYLKNKEIVATKNQIIDDITEKGFRKTEIEKEINRLKEQGEIIYSRTTPKGWSLSK